VRTRWAGRAREQPSFVFITSRKADMTVGREEAEHIMRVLITSEASGHHKVETVTKSVCVYFLRERRDGGRNEPGWRRGAPRGVVTAADMTPARPPMQRSSKVLGCGSDSATDRENTSSDSSRTGTDWT
jgi:hypothetical protein